MADLATHYRPGINNKTPREIIKRLIESWVGEFGVPKILSDKWISSKMMS